MQRLDFLASCETNNVLNGEGLVSIAWALLGSVSSSVVSAQWDDLSTQLFTQEFYRHYRGGKHSAKTLQAAAIVLIKNKTFHGYEPYFRAASSLLGDYR
ncbi:MAG: CHAT domain-containing protein [Acidobacteria bacterium]|nr:CHAT domain-containing protein [Acidobacteriota bacterium]